MDYCLTHKAKKNRKNPDKWQVYNDLLVTNQGMLICYYKRQRGKERERERERGGGGGGGQKEMRKGDKR